MMRFLGPTFLLLVLAISVFAVEQPTAEDAARIKKAEAAAVADPNNQVKLRELLKAYSWYKSPEDIGYETWLSVLQAEMDSLIRIKPTEEIAVKRVDHVINYRSVTISNFRAPLADLEKLLEVNPDDCEVMTAFSCRSRQLIEELSETDPAKATAILQSLKAHVAKVTENCSDNGMKTYMASHASFMPAIENRFITRRKWGALLNKEAPELQVESWIQGESVKLADLKGKVVLIDFWAVWCGPCIECIPKIQVWQKKYSDKGLVIIGVSRSCNFTLDEATGKATLREGEESPPNELELFRKYARHHKIDYPLAIEKQGSQQNSEYGRTGIPQLVLIGKDGRVKMIRSGYGEESAKEVESMLDRLVKE